MTRRNVWGHTGHPVLLQRGLHSASCALWVSLWGPLSPPHGKRGAERRLLTDPGPPTLPRASRSFMKVFKLRQETVGVPVLSSVHCPSFVSCGRNRIAQRKHGVGALPPGLCVWCTHISLFCVISTSQRFLPLFVCSFVCFLVFKLKGGCPWGLQSGVSAAEGSAANPSGQGDAEPLSVPEARHCPT